MKLAIKRNIYEGQALAVVLIIIVVAAIIALAIMSRVKSEQRNVADERSSSQSLSVSDNILDAVISLPISTIAKAINTEENEVLSNLCKKDSLDYEFWEDGCVLDDTEEVSSFLTALDDIDVNVDPVYSVIASQMESELVASCGETQHDVKMTILPIEEGEKIILQEGVVLSLIPDTIPVGGCNINVEAETVRDGVKAGIIENAIYVNEILGSAEYDYSLNKGYCLFDCIGDLSWVGANPTNYDNGWVNSPNGASFGRSMMLTQNGNNYSLNELRLRPIGDDVAISYTTSTNGCKLKEIMKLMIITSCSGITQGKETIIPRANWAPSVFDYSIYNGQGIFEYEN